MDIVARFKGFAAALCLLFFACEKPNLPVFDPDNGGLILPENFKALVVVDSIDGHAREIHVADKWGYFR